MSNFKLVGLNPYMNLHMKQILCAEIRRQMKELGFKDDDVVITTPVPHDHPEMTEEGICAYGFSAGSECNHMRACIPEGLAVSVVDSNVETLSQIKTPYAEVHARTPERIEEIVKLMKERHFGWDVEKHLIPLLAEMYKFEYPYVQIISDSPFAPLGSLILRMRELGVRVYTKDILGFLSAEEMR